MYKKTLSTYSVMLPVAWKEEIRKDYSFALHCDKCDDEIEGDQYPSLIVQEREILSPDPDNPHVNDMHFCKKCAVMVRSAIHLLLMKAG